MDCIPFNYDSGIMYALVSAVDNLHQILGLLSFIYHEAVLPPFYEVIN